MNKYVISSTKVVQGNEEVTRRWFNMSFSSPTEAKAYIHQKFPISKWYALMPDEIKRGIFSKYIYKRYGENNSLNTYLIRIHKINLKEDSQYEET